MHMKSLWRIRSLLPLLLICLLASLGLPAHAQAQDGSRPSPYGSQEAPERSPMVNQEVSPSGIAETVVTLPAIADAYIASERPNENFGFAALFVGYHIVGDDNFGAQRSLLRFDLGNIPVNARIVEARMRLYQSFATPGDTEAMRIIVRQLNSAWGEQSVTWNTEPVWGDVRAETFVAPDEGWVEWDLTALVSDWVSNQATNHGVELIGDERVQQRERAFNSRETETDLFPRLIVRYAIDVDTEPPVVRVNPLPLVVPRNFTVSWSGTEPGGSGIAYYDVQVQVDGGAWTNWQMGTTSVNAEFVGESGRTYAFRARGVDNAGNIEAFGGAEASTLVDAGILFRMWLPLTAQFAAQ
jgi:hypothetical protein